MTSSQRITFLLTTCLVLAFVSYAWMFSDISVPNERTRAYLTFALVHEHTLTIDTPVSLFGPAQDWARFQNHTYTDKAPGSSLLAVPIFALYSLFQPLDQTPFHTLLQLIRFVLMLPATALGLVFAYASLRKLRVSHALALLCAASPFVATCASHYSGAFYGHVLVGVALLGALYTFLCSLSPHTTTRRSSLYAALCGTCLGVAGILEYQSAGACILAWCCAATLYTSQKRPLHLLWLSLAAAPWLLVLLAYHNAAFGGPLELPYHHLVSQRVQNLHTKGVGGVSLPSLRTLFDVFFSLHRGLLFTSPISVLALIALPAYTARSLHTPSVLQQPRTFWVGWSLLGLYYLAFIASADAWYAGWSFGPRLLVPLLLLLPIPLGCMMQAALRSPPRAAHWLLVGVATCALSTGLAVNAIATAIFPEPPPDALNPFLDVFWPMAQHGLVSPNLMMCLTHTTGTASLLPFWGLCGTLWGLGIWAMLHAVPTSEPAPPKRRFGLGVALALTTVLTLSATAGIVWNRGPSWSTKQRDAWATLAFRWHIAETVRGCLKAPQKSAP